MCHLILLLPFLGLPVFWLWPLDLALPVYVLITKCDLLPHFDFRIEEVERLFGAGLLAPAGNHTTMDYATILQIGFDGLVERIEARVERLSPDEPGVVEKRQFLDALQLGGVLVADHRLGFERPRQDLGVQQEPGGAEV